MCFKHSYTIDKWKFTSFAPLEIGIVSLATCYQQTQLLLWKTVYIKVKKVHVTTMIWNRTKWKKWSINDVTLSSRVVSESPLNEFSFK